MKWFLKILNTVLGAKRNFDTEKTNNFTKSESNQIRNVTELNSSKALQSREQKQMKSNDIKWELCLCVYLLNLHFNWFQTANIAWKWKFLALKLRVRLWVSLRHWAHTASQKIYPNRIDRKRQKGNVLERGNNPGKCKVHTLQTKHKKRVQALNTSCFTALDLSTIFRLISSVAVFTLRLIYCHALCYRTHAAAAAAALEYTNTYLWCAHHFISFWCFIMAQLVNFNGIRRKLYAYILLQLFIREFRAIKMWQIRHTHTFVRWLQGPFSPAILHAIIKYWIKKYFNQSINYPPWIAFSLKFVYL